MIMAISGLTACGDSSLTADCSKTESSNSMTESSSSAQTTISETQTTTTEVTTSAATTTTQVPETNIQPKTNQSPLPHNEQIQVGEKFAEVRKKADEIEIQFGIRVLVGSEVKNIQQDVKTYSIRSADDDMDSDTVRFHIEQLERIQNQLARYPKGFFDHFRSKDGNCGLRIALTSGIVSESVSPAAITFHEGEWYNIAVNCISLFDNGTLNHEMWHAVEFLIDSQTPLDTSKWDKLNPAGFTYSRDYADHAQNVTVSDDTLLSISESDNIRYDVPYFVEDYSKVYAVEDRATVIETVFKWSFDGQDAPKNGLTEINKYPHIKAKLDLLGEWSKKEFGYVYWEEIIKGCCK